MSAAWLRVSKPMPCPICGKPDWCAISADGAVVLCQRIASPKRCGDSGWLHRLRDDTGRHRRGRVVQIRPRASDICDEQLTDLANTCARDITDAMVARLAGKLGLTSESLRQFGIGWDGEAWTFPMRDADRRIVGIRRRLPNGRKLSVKGGHEGLFIPSDLADTGALLVCEGPTDAAAMLDLDFAVIGRPSCSGGTRHIVALAHGRDVVILADADEPGRRGADSLASILMLYCPTVRIITPPDPLKDARAWLRAGGTHHDVQQFLDDAEIRRIQIQSG